MNIASASVLAEKKKQCKRQIFLKDPFTTVAIFNVCT